MFFLTAKEEMRMNTRFSNGQTCRKYGRESAEGANPEKRSSRAPCVRAGRKAVSYTHLSNYDKLGEDGGIFDPAHNDLPWIETTFQINKSMVKDPVNFEFEVKIENSHIVSGTTAAVDGGVPAGNAYSDGSATFTRTIDLSNSAAYQDPTRDTITLKYNAATVSYTHLDVYKRQGRGL